MSDIYIVTIYKVLSRKYIRDDSVLFPVISHKL